MSHNSAFLKTQMAETAHARKAAALQMKGVDADGDGQIDPEEARRAERLLAHHQERVINLLQLMREKIRSIVGSDGFAEIARIFKKFDIDNSGTISWVEFDRAMEFLGLHIEDAELQFLAQLFDKDGSGDMEYLEFVGWLDTKSFLNVTKLSNTIFASASKIGSGKKKKREPTRAYMEAWLKRHSDIRQAALKNYEEEKNLAAEELRQANAVKYATSMKGSVMKTAHMDSKSLQASIMEAKERSASGNERKVMESLKLRQKVKQRAVDNLKKRITAITGETDARKIVEELWRKFDVNDDGLITWKEFCQGMKLLGVNMTDSELLSIMSEFDANSDGGVDYYEFLHTIVPESNKLTDEDVIVRDYHIAVDFLRKQMLSRQAEEAKNNKIMPAQIDNMWHTEGRTLEAHNVSCTAAQGTLRGGHHWVKQLPNEPQRIPRSGGRFF